MIEILIGGAIGISVGLVGLWWLHTVGLISCGNETCPTIWKRLNTRRVRW